MAQKVFETPIFGARNAAEERCPHSIIFLVQCNSQKQHVSRPNNESAWRIPLPSKRSLDFILSHNKAFGEIHTKIDPAKIRGYGGKKVDRYESNFDVQKIFDALKKLSAVTDQVKAEMLDKASQR